MPIEFINADLEVTSNENLTPIKIAFAAYGYRFTVMYCGKTDPDCYFASFEVHPDEERDDQTAEEKIHAFCDSISKLQGEARELWNRATQRVIDLGYQSDNLCKSFKDCLSVKALSRLEALSIELAVTIYPQKFPEAEPQR